MTRFRFRAAAFLPLFFVLMVVSGASADPATLQKARDALAVLAAKHRAAPAFTLAFTSRAIGADGDSMPPVRGTLLAADSGRFRLTHAQGVVVSDGHTLWQHFPSTKQVVIRPAKPGTGAGEETGGAGGVLLRFLQARAVDAARTPAGSGAGLRVVLDPASVGENLDSLVLLLSADGMAVRGVETQDPAGNRVSYTVSSLRYDARPGRAAFEFKVPAGAEVVDMR
jgi:outer membrane lipoprotein-sorting protein